MRKPVLEFLTRSHTSRTVQPQKRARGLKIWIGLFYLHVCSENRSADQLRGYHVAALHFCFPLYAKINRYSHDAANIYTCTYN